MRYKQLDIFRDTDTGRGMRLSLAQAQELTCQQFLMHGSDRSTWVFGYSGGKDSSACLTYADWAMGQGLIPTPEHRIIVYADTLMELPPLAHAASRLLSMLEGKGWRVVHTQPALNGKRIERFFVAMLGRGYAPPSNHFRWCTDRLKSSKIEATYKFIAEEYGTDFMGIDGVRKGESAARDQIILAHCSKSDGECGQGLFHNSAYGGGKLSPILHWRVCHVWDWLFEADVLHGYPVASVAETYGMSVRDGDEPLEARTGCIGCPLVTASNTKKPRSDKALDTVVASEKWNHLAPYQGLSRVYWELKWNDSCRHFNLRGRKGCLTLAARKWALEEILGIQNKSARLAIAAGRTPYLLISEEEEHMIRQMLADHVFPDPRRYSAEELASGKPMVMVK